MHTIPTTSTATAGPILAIDLGKDKSVACIYRLAGAESSTWYCWSINV